MQLVAVAQTGDGVIPTRKVHRPRGAQRIIPRVKDTDHIVREVSHSTDGGIAAGDQQVASQTCGDARTFPDQRRRAAEDVRRCPIGQESMRVASISKAGIPDVIDKLRSLRTRLISAVIQEAPAGLQRHVNRYDRPGERGAK